jgi:hypothetical protein
VGSQKKKKAVEALKTYRSARADIHHAAPDAPPPARSTLAAAHLPQGSLKQVLSLLALLVHTKVQIMAQLTHLDLCSLEQVLSLLALLVHKYKY